MTERIDHTGRAENAMQNGIKLRNAGIINDATFQATLAQASATLALVEQQRIANLIAYAADVDVIRAGNHDVNVAIREALGLS